MSLIFKLLTAQAGHHYEPAADLGQAGHVYPELLELRDGEDIFLSVTPPFFHVLERYIRWHAGGKVANGFRHAGFVLELVACEAEQGEQFIQVDPAGVGVVIAERELEFLARHCETFHESHLAVHSSQAATPVLQPARNHLKSQPRSALNVHTQQARVDICSQRIDVMEHEVFELRARGQNGAQGTVAEKIGQLVPVSYGMHALQRHIVRIVTGFAGGARPAHERLTQAVPNFLLLLIEDLLGHFLPLKAKVADGGHHAQSHGFAGRKEQWPGIAVVGLTCQELLRGIVREVTRGKNVDKGSAGDARNAPALGEVCFDERAVFAVNATKRMQGLNDARALSPATTCSGCEADDGHFPSAQGLFANFDGSGWRAVGGQISDVTGSDVFDDSCWRQTVLSKTYAALFEVGADLLMCHAVEPVLVQQGGERLVA